MSIKDCWTVEKIQQKLEKGINFEYLIFVEILKKKFKEYSEKLWGNFKIIEKMFMKLN